MEAPLEDEPLAGVLARIEGDKLAASDSALTFLSSIGEFNVVCVNLVCTT